MSVLVGKVKSCGKTAIAAGVTSNLWEMSDMVRVLEEWEAANTK